ncbi:H-NS histone family protein [Bradyrhizobium sp. Arg237L]|uniref:H-NS histone family protein n=1 Tax=Bradyrhizobium sp. Arg237L TaxID=3003352 RepID=UPI00249D97B3|nr:H-NS histone family protein [Bradyrhizobium sp. Arg237L]MDI4231601.1 H-NS histone family protein [Bradyrhizobium sp. Arg237L]
MRRTELKRMSSDRLWTLRVELADVLRQKIQSMKAQLEDRLKKLRTPTSARRPYPEIQPKYRNPDQPSETWAGRGKKPRWLVAQLRLGKRIDDFKIKVRKKSRIAVRLARIST